MLINGLEMCLRKKLVKMEAFLILTRMKTMFCKQYYSFTYPAVKEPEQFQFLWIKIIKLLIDQLC